MKSLRLPLAAAVLALAAALPAQAQVAVMHAGAAPLTKDQVANVYLGRSADLTPLDLPEGSATRDSFYRKATEREPAQVKSTWARIVFTGKGQPPKELPDPAAVKKAVNADHKAIGYIDKSAVDGSVKVVLSLD